MEPPVGAGRLASADPATRPFPSPGRARQRASGQGVGLLAPTWSAGEPASCNRVRVASSTRLASTLPPQREWRGLMDEEVESAFMANTCCDDLVVYEHIARAIEAKLKEKNT